MSKLDPTIGQPESLQIVLYEKKHIYICMYVRKITSEVGNLMLSQDHNAIALFVKF